VAKQAENFALMHGKIQLVQCLHIAKVAAQLF